MKKVIKLNNNKHFYTHIIDTSALSLELGDMPLSQEERFDLVNLVDSNIHNVVLDTVLSALPDEDKKTFLHLLAVNDHSKIWKHLNSKIDNIEEKIKKASHALRDDLHKDIKEIKSL